MMHRIRLHFTFLAKYLSSTLLHFSPEGRRQRNPETWITNLPLFPSAYSTLPSNKLSILSALRLSLYFTPTFFLPNKFPIHEILSPSLPFSLAFSPSVLLTCYFPTSISYFGLLCHSRATLGVFFFHCCFTSGYFSFRFVFFRFDLAYFLLFICFIRFTSLPLCVLSMLTFFSS